MGASSSSPSTESKTNPTHQPPGQWVTDGFRVANGLLDASEISDLRIAAEKCALGMHGEDFVNKRGPGELFSHPDFRWLIVDPRILGLARQLLGPEVVYFGDSKLSVMDTRGTFHKDNGHRGLWPVGPGYDPFDPAEGHYDVLRFMIYLQDHQEFAGNLRVRTGSHTSPVAKARVWWRDLLYWRMGRLKTFPGVPTGKRRNLNTKPGDVVAFNLRTTHGVNAVRLARFPNLCIAPSVERLIPTSLRAPETTRFALQITFGAPGVHLERFIHSRKRTQFLHRYRTSTMDDATTRALAADAGLRLRFDLIENARLAPPK